MREKKEKIRKKSNTHLVKNYGNALSAGKVEKKEGEYKISIKTSKPQVLKDDKEGIREVKFLTFREIGDLYLNNELEPIDDKSTSKQEIHNKIKKKRRLWNERINNLIISETAMKLAKIEQISQTLTPITEIVYRLSEDREIHFEDINKLKEEDKTKKEKYYRLLESLDLVEQTKKGYKYANLFTEFSKSTENEKELKEKILGYVIQESYPSLRDLFEITTIEPYIDIEFEYFKPTLEYGEILRKRKQLINVNIFQKEDSSYIKGNKEIFDNILKNKKTISKQEPIPI